MTPSAIVMEILLVPVKNRISLISTPLSKTEGSAWKRHGYHNFFFIVLTLTIRLSRVNGPWFRQQLEISVLIKTGPAAKVLSWQQMPFCFV